VPIRDTGPMDLPRRQVTEGRAPDDPPRFLPRIMEAWLARYQEEGHDVREFAVDGARIRGSWAGICARALGYKILEHDAQVRLADIENIDNTDEIEARIAEAEAAAPSNPPTLASYWRMFLGQLVHELLAPDITAAFPNAHVEVGTRFDDFGAITADIVIDDDDHIVLPTDVGPGRPFRTVIELKSLNGFGFKMGTTTFKGPPQGPKYLHLYQGALQAEALDADELIIGWVALENVSAALSAGVGVHSDVSRFTAEWTYTPEEFLPIARTERKRMRRILDAIDDGILPPRVIPDPELPKGAVVTNPRGAKGVKGLWQVLDTDGKILQAGDTWHCEYCDFQDRCIADGGPGMVPVQIR